MFAPVIGVNGKVYYVAPEKIVYFEPGDPLPATNDRGEPDLAPDGNPWPTTYLNFTPEWCLHVKGTMQMILHSWFGSPEARAEKQPDLILPAHLLKRRVQ